MIQTTKALLRGLQKMLKSRGSMTVEEVHLLRKVIKQLKYHDELKGEERLMNKLMIVELMWVFFMHPAISEHVSQTVAHLMETLL